jgi:FAD:protein FMN transferase
MSECPTANFNVARWSVGRFATSRPLRRSIEMLSRRNFLSFDFARGGAADSDHWVRVHRIAMACRFEVMLPSSDAHDMAAARSALDEADRLEAMLTVFRDNSEVVHVNQTAGEEDVRISPELFELLQLSERIHQETAGAFDVTSNPLSRCWGFLRREGRLPEDAALQEARGCVGMSKVTLDVDRQTVRFDHPGVELNFGSIGKGYAMDRMAALLRARGVRHALLSAGASSVVAVGGQGEGWPVDLRPRRARARVARVLLRNGAVGTSGAGEQFFEIDGRRYGHVLDPRTGWPASGVLGVSVITREAAFADALSTAFLVEGPVSAEHYCATHTDTLVVVVPEDNPEHPLVFGSYAGATLQLQA